MRRLPPWIWLVLALVLGVAATYMALGWLQALSRMAEKTQQERMTSVVLAAKDIEEATTLGPEHLKVEPRAPETLPKDYFSNKEELVGRMTKARIQAKEIISTDRLAEKGAVAGLPSKVVSNKRAMTVKVDETSGVAGFLNQGDRVDVVVTIKGGVDYVKDPVSKMVLQNLKVLATGPQLEARSGGKSQVVPTVTLEVTPEEGERLALAAMEGYITLVLRSQYDREIVPTGGMNAPRLLGNLAPPPPPPRRSVEVLRRIQRDAVSF